MVGFPSVFKTVNIPFYLYDSLFILLSVNMWFASKSWLLWIMLQWAWMCRYLFKILTSVLLGKGSEVNLLHHVVVLVYFLEESPYCFPQWLNHFTFAPIYTNVVIFFTSSVTPAIFCFYSSTYVFPLLFIFSYISTIQCRIIFLLP